MRFVKETYVYIHNEVWIRSNQEGSFSGIVLHDDDEWAGLRLCLKRFQRVDNICEINISLLCVDTFIELIPHHLRAI